MLLWANFRRFYLYVMTENMKRVLMAHQQLVLTEEVKTRYQLCERSIFSAASLPEFDEAYTRYLRQFIKFNNHLKKNSKNCHLLYICCCRRLAGYETVDEMYKQSSCSLFMDTITVPIVFINAQDDPIVPEPLLSIPQQYVGKLPKRFFV